MTAAGPAVENFYSALEPKPQINQAGAGVGAQISAHQSALPPALVRGTGRGGGSEGEAGRE